MSGQLSHPSLHLIFHSAALTLALHCQCIKTGIDFKNLSILPGTNIPEQWMSPARTSTFVCIALFHEAIVDVHG